MLSLNTYLIAVIIGTGLVSWLCRVLPFVLLKRFGMPRFLTNFLAFVPVAIMAAFVASNLFVRHAGSLPTLNVPNFLAAIPCVITAVLTRSLLAIAAVGVVTMALIRFLM
ncbi:AzlD domain-containing protein [Lacticaseibacillus pabuli]|uniref:AzlD domain-containing protein n=1 Tax=Lacticaseibacillus pabuli TaxID=3025672 RepID=A0ABY7X037_9LACO|nr:AzlD domain-containing protein [Lacticaseibacillus sp. KACC 23028]WDF83515.1 AzlD domain-containing protein [Lacticaseibacillus sp. KACC 23028]